MRQSSIAYTTHLTNAGAWISIAAVGASYGNIKAADSFRTLKQEEVAITPCQMFQVAETNLGRIITDVSSARWRSLNPGCLPPSESGTMDLSPEWSILFMGEFHMKELVPGSRIAA